MRKFLVNFGFSMILVSCTLLAFPMGTASVINAENQVPPYAKWGKLAMEKTKEKYPDAAITDYLHVGRFQGPKSSTEKFKLWLKRRDKEFGVFVEIEFDQKTEKLIGISFREVSN